MTDMLENQAAPFDAARHVAMAFATPVAHHRWPGHGPVNAALRELILTRQSEDPGIVRANVGSWHSRADLFAWDGEAVRALCGWVHEMLAGLTQAVTLKRPDAPPRTVNYRLEGWANVTRDGGYSSVHSHPHSTWSGVYYVAAGEPAPGLPHNGQLELLDPRAGADQTALDGTVFGSRYLVETLPGLMIMFPGWLKHTVYPFRGTGERISIAFNVVMQEAASPTMLP